MPLTMPPQPITSQRVFCENWNTLESAILLIGLPPIPPRPRLGEITLHSLIGSTTKPFPTLFIQVIVSRGKFIYNVKCHPPVTSIKIRR